MSLRQVMQDKPVIAIAIIVVALAVIGYRMLGGSGQPSGDQWFYDLETGELVAYAGREMPPIQLDNGHRAVLAQVWACGRCRDIDPDNIAFIEKWSDEGKVYWQQRSSEVAREKPKTGPGSGPGPAGMTMDEPDRLVAATPAAGEPPKWHPSRSPFGARITHRIQNMRGECGDDELVNCRP